MRYRLTVEYLGTGYSGWQRQKNHITVQEVLENAIFDLFAQEIRVEASGRTDTGVHALGQVAHFDAEKVLPGFNVMLALNARLPKEIRVKQAEQVSDNFHARFDAKRKTYIYKLYRSRTLSPTRYLTHAQILPDIDVGLMQTAAKDLVGTHDFKGFQATGSFVKDTVRTIFSASVTEIGDEVHISVTGNGFLYNMVRILTGTLVYIGQGKLPVGAIKTVLKTKDRVQGGKTFPPEGLYLASVEYEDDYSLDGCPR